jgi:hypothetical protein
MWVLPSVDRLPRVRALLAQMRATGISTPGVVILEDGADAGAIADELPPNWVVMCDAPGADSSLVARLNRVWDFTRDLDGSTWYGLIADDNWPVTEGWDKALIETAMRTGIASCDDGWQAPRRMHSAVVWRANVLRAAGFWMPRCLRHNYVDDFWETIGRRFGFWTCLRDVRVEHRHWKQDETIEKDAIYTLGESSMEADFAAFMDWTRGEDHSAIVQQFSQIALADRPEQGNRLTRARSRSVFIATPVARHPVRQYTSSLMRTISLLGALGIRCYVQNIVGSSNLPRARNELVAAFLATDYTDLLFIDDDMGWDAQAVVRVLASDKPVVAAIGAKKVERDDEDPAKWCFMAAPEAEYAQDDMGNIRVWRVGTGFLKIERRVFEEMALRHPEWKRSGWANMPDDAKRWYYRFFAFPDDPDETGEDFFFCNNWRAMGGEIWMDPTIRLTHVGEKEYSGNLTALLQREDAP